MQLSNKKVKLNYQLVQANKGVDILYFYPNDQFIKRLLS